MAEDASADSSSDGRSLCHGLLHHDGWSLILREHPTAEADSVRSVFLALRSMSRVSILSLHRWKELLPTSFYETALNRMRSKL